MDKPKLTIDQLHLMRESENHVEFKRCQQGNLSFNGSDKQKPSDRRKCILGYVVALSNAGGGPLLKTGKTTNTVYSLSPEFRGQMSLLQEATRIGLTHILKGQDDSNIINDSLNDGISDGISDGIK